MITGLSSAIGTVQVMTTQGRGSSPEEIAERALDKIIYVGSQTHPAIREQAEAYRDNIRKVLVYYMHETIRAHNVTLVNRFNQAGHPEMTSILGV